MKVIRLAVVVGWILMTAANSTGADCPKGEKQLHPNEACIPTSLFNYLYCLEKSGGGRIEITRQESKDAKKDIEIKLAGKGSGIVLKGSGTGKASKSESEKVAGQIHEKLDPSLAAICSNFGKEKKAPPAQKKDKKNGKVKPESDKKLRINHSVPPQLKEDTQTKEKLIKNNSGQSQSPTYSSFSAVALATDQDEALKASRDILTSIQQKQYEKLWKSQVSQFFKSKITKDSFIANLTLGRQQLGAPGESKFIDITYAQTDPATGYKGEIYSFNYLDTYAAGKFYERIVVIKEQDGKFRLSGIWSAPAPD